MLQFIQSTFVRIAVLALAALCLPFFAHASGQVTGPNGEYKESHVDLSVAVLGGPVMVNRSWLNGRWYINPAWADLRFTYDALEDGSVKTIDRAGSVFEGSGDLYVFDDRFFVRKTSKVVEGSPIDIWRWNDTAGNWVEYDIAGKIMAYGDRNNVSVRFVRNGAGKISEVRDHLNALTLTLAYTGDDLTRITDRSGRFVEYVWTNGNLTLVKDVLGNDWSYTYDGNGQITGGTDPEARSWSLTYLRSFRATGAGVPVGVSFSGLAGRDFRISRVATFKNEAGHTMIYEYDYNRSKREWSYIRKFPLNAPNGRVEETVHDLDGRVVRQLEGSVVTYQRTKDGDHIEYDKDERGQVTRRELDGTRNVTKITYPDGASESWVYHPRFAFPIEHIDARGTQTTYQYDDRGNRIEMIEAVGEPEARTTLYVWNNLGQMTSTTIKGATAADDATTAYTYDGFGNVDSITDAEEVTTHYTHHVTGQVEATTDGRGKVWANTYDAAGRLKSSKNPIDPATTFDYDKAGNRTHQTDSAGYTTQYRYDELNRLVKTIDAKQGEIITIYNADGQMTGQSDQSGQTTTMLYDMRGRPWKVIDGVGNIIETIYGTHLQALDGLVAARQYPTYREEYKYDARGRKTHVTRVLDVEHRETTVIGYDANGNSISITDPSGRVTLHAYDRQNRLVQTTDALGGVTHYSYDSRNNQLGLNDPNQSTHRFTYDRRDRVKTEAQPMGQTHRYSYDTNGNQIEKIDAKNQKFSATYDDVGRITKAEYFEASASNAHKTVVFSYDNRGLLIGYDDGTTSATYAYDELGREKSAAVNYGPFTLSHSYSYHANGQKASYTAPDGSTFRYEYTNHGQLRRLAIPLVGSIEFSSFIWRRPRVITYPGGVVRTVNFDAFMRTTSIDIKNANDIHLIHYAYEYDAVGNVLTKTTEHGTYHYDYDALDRLTRADYPNGPGNDQIGDNFSAGTFPFKDDQFGYDLLGNRLADVAQTDSASWHYNANNELISNSLMVLTYNENGSMTERRALSSALEQRRLYNSEERLIEIKNASDETVATYYYDPFGRRLWKTVYANMPGNESSTARTTFLYYSDEGYAAEYIRDGIYQNSGQNFLPVLEQLYVFAPQGMWSTELLAIRQGGESIGWRYVEPDHLGTPVGLFDSLGHSVSEARFNSFGEVRMQGEKQNMRFAGQIADMESGAYYNFNRNYLPSVGRYIESDPIGLAGGKNTFVYALQNPLKIVDPFGLQSSCANPANALACAAAGSGNFGGGTTAGGAAAGGAAGGGTAAAGGGGSGSAAAAANAAAAAALAAAAGQTGPTYVPADPGKCTIQQHRQLQDEVDRLCKPNPGSCRPGEKCILMSGKEYLHRQCAFARRRINETCFPGRYGDSGHPSEHVTRLNQADVCVGLMPTCCE